MDLKEKLLSSFIAFENQTNIDSYVHEVRSEAIKQFESIGFPDKKLENWKYTSLKNLLNTDYTVLPEINNVLEFKNIKKYLIDDIDSYKVIFVDGKYCSHLSETTHEGMDICILSAALTQSKYELIIENYFNKIALKDGITSLNTAFSNEGVFIHIPKNKFVEKPIQIIHFSTGNESSLMFQPRNMIVVDENSQVQIIERHQSLSKNKVFTNSVTEIYADKKSIIDYYKIQNDNLQASLIDNTYVNQQRNSSFSMHTFSFGNELVRNNLNISQNDEFIETTIKGITIIGDNQHVDHNTLIQHNKPNCNSHQDYKGIYDNKSTGVFNGQIVVNKQAQKTNAFQSNNNILLSNKATINAKPQLEIYADDVKCSHGCTVGQLDKNALFYLKSRGIPEKEATALLMYGFANNILKSVKIPEIKTRITNIIANKLGVKIGFNL
ncbi:MAG: Fe-S cluster assembly protein SufD [Flavobacteriaceae bacterium]|nr:Fe-S cluster assembly protein SufD [Flavobacteriaceae bacterium]MBT4113921.1 Fe-S cluster assembly protein SufD [Flavobacteriaceae bacterium]MBT4613879.1 Fe-S cluster assembly protein SufD [Flavobacteriaceae bacterium]MBT5246620.1 Fe-S cluster assembly protein SufD [Flavobacteriaceae bacterium]MBT5649599.1 Fe-S cluster assembly protein SufD [Flavobacteriaceae bacterium]